MILEEGREPSSMMWAALLGLGGIGAILAGLVVLVRSFVSD